MFSWINAINRKMIHTCTGLCKLFVNELYKGRSGQRAWPVAYPPRKRITTFSCWICVGGSRRTTLCMPRLHTGTWSRYPGCRTKQKHAWSDQKAEQGERSWEGAWETLRGTTAAATLTRATTGRSRRTNPTANCSKAPLVLSQNRADRFLLMLLAKPTT